MSERAVSVKKNTNNIETIYSIGRLIGLGNYGEVRRIEHRASKVQRALKIISKKHMEKS